MLNLIPLTQNNHLVCSVREFFSSLGINGCVKSPDPKINFIIVNDSNPLEGLLYIKDKNFNKFNDRIIILSSIITEKIARRFINEECRFVCLPQNAAINAFIEAYDNLNDWRDIIPMRGKSRLLSKKEKHFACELHRNDFCEVTILNLGNNERRRMSHKKYRIIKKLELKNKVILHRIISSPQFSRAIHLL